MNLHPGFYVSMLRKHIRDPNAIEPERVEGLQPNLTYPEGPIRLGDRRVRKLKNREIPQIQVFWGRQNRQVITWEDEENFRKNYPEFYAAHNSMEQGEAS
ncbi:unnamed protein product [Microthlaspi erraticum]|uniref:Chromo domain-containing protein n=1 Tax=Microthlaspi erraticum TaxID=1685480 RepID=A0A6D2JXU4_9BRAS|nr:unnamed protein product [Microthlaspi erraticum]